MPLAAVPAILGGIVSAGQAIGGASQLQKDKAELKRLTPAFYKIQDEYYRNERQAAGMAGQGITEGAKDFYSDMAGAGLGTGVSAALTANADPSMIAKIFDSYNSSIRKLATDDAEMQINNIKYYNQVGKELAGQKNQQWAINEYQPYQNKLKELTTRIAADKQNIWNGLQGMVGAGQAAVTATQNEKLLKGLFKESGGVGNVAAGGIDAASGGMAGISEGLFSDMSDPFQKSGSVSMNPGFDEVTGVNFGKVAKSAMANLSNSDRAEWLNSMSADELQALMADIQSSYKSKE